MIQRFTLVAICVIAAGRATAAPVTVITVDGRTLKSEVRTWTIPDGLKLADGSVIATRDLDVVLPTSGDSTAPRGGWIVELHDGSAIIADPAGGDDQSLIVTSQVFDPLRLNIDVIASIHRSNVPARRLPPAGDEDMALLTTGDAARGSIARFGRDELNITVNGQDRMIPWKSLHTVVLARANRTTLAAPCVDLELTDGSRLRAAAIYWLDGKLSMQGSFGDSTITSARVVRMEVNGFRRTWLSDVAPARYESTPYLDKTWPMQVNANALGESMVAQGQLVRRGIGLHAPCKATWNLGGRFQRFRCQVALDDSAGDMADADVTITLDGRKAVEHRGLAHRQTPRAVDLDVTGVKEMTIEIGVGKSAHVQDRVNLLNAALVLP